MLVVCCLCVFDIGVCYCLILLIAFSDCLFCLRLLLYYILLVCLLVGCVACYIILLAIGFCGF